MCRPQNILCQYKNESNLLISGPLQKLHTPSCQWPQQTDSWGPHQAWENHSKPGQVRKQTHKFSGYIRSGGVYAEHIGQVSEESNKNSQ